MTHDDDKPARRGWSDEKRANVGRPLRDTRKLDVEDACDREDPTSPATPSALRDEPSRLELLERRVVAIAGEDGDNGKVGRLRGDVDGLRRFLIAVIVSAAGALGVAGVALYRAGEKDGRTQLRLEQVEHRVENLEDRDRRDRRWFDPITPPAPPAAPGGP